MWAGLVMEAPFAGTVQNVFNGIYAEAAGERIKRQ